MADPANTDSSAEPASSGTAEAPIATVNVSASATIEVEPDEASIHFDLSASERSAEKAHDAISVRLRDLEAVLDELAMDPRDRTSTVQVAEQGEHDRGKWLSRGYLASASLTVVARDPEIVGRMVNEAVRRAGPRVRGPYWRVSADHPARLEACGRAAASARHKAEAYVTALGARLGEIVRVAEPGARTIERSPYDMPAATAPPAVAMAAAESRQPIDLRPGRQQVYATVEVIFRIEGG